MSETVKLIIEIPEEIMEYVKNNDCLSVIYIDEVAKVIQNGIPLDDVKAEIKAMFPPSGNWMYDEEYEHEHTVCEVLADVLKILDNIGKGDSE